MIKFDNKIQGGVFKVTKQSTTNRGDGKVVKIVAES